MTSPAGRVLGIVVTYHPDRAILDRVFAALVPEVDHVVVIDNQSTEESRRVIAEAGGGIGPDVSAHPRSVELVSNAGNEGVSVAFNQGISRALTRGFDFVFLVDQDSVVRRGAVGILLEQYQELGARFPVGALQAANAEPGGRVTLDTRRREFYLRRNGFQSDAAFQGLLLMNSGALIPVTSIRAVGSFDERYFVDFVDYEFSLRLARHGFRVFHVPGAVIDHNVSDAGPPDVRRLYYAERELVRLIRTYGPGQVSGVAPIVWTTVNRIGSLLLRSGYPGRVLRLTVRAMFDGLLGVTGELPPSVSVS